MNVHIPEWLFWYALGFLTPIAVAAGSIRYDDWRIRRAVKRSRGVSA